MLTITLFASTTQLNACDVIQILLRNRLTNLNSRTHDGTTPLILAARLNVEGMVGDLIEAEADINAMDDKGKSALHWAAAVNNAEATLILLQHGANRDAQDHMVGEWIGLFHRKSSMQYSSYLLYLSMVLVQHGSDLLLYMGIPDIYMWIPYKCTKYNCCHL